VVDVESTVGVTLCIRIYHLDIACDHRGDVHQDVSRTVICQTVTLHVEKRVLIKEEILGYKHRMYWISGR
jgi:hypothetical protein